MVGLIEGLEIRNNWRISTDPGKTEDEYGHILPFSWREFAGVTKDDLTGE